MAQIPLPSLLLDDKNPRLHASDQPRSQLEILRELALSDEYADKILVLARDIVQHGLDPSSLVCVYKKDLDSKQYVVLEGNRRIAALKLLLNPDIIAGLADTGRLKEFKKLSESFALPPIINCILFDDEAQADHWIDLKHTGQHGGAGMVPWGAVETLRFSYRNSTKPIELQLLDFAATYISEFDPSHVKITNLERLISDPNVREGLGIEIIRSVVHSRRNLNDFAKLMSIFLSSIMTEGFTVNRIKTKSDRHKFISEFLENNKRAIEMLPISDSEAFPINGKGPTAETKRISHKAAKGVIKTSVHKTIFTPIASGKKYSDKTKILAKELKDFGFEKSPFSSIYLMKAFLENLVRESLALSSGNFNLKTAIKTIALQAEIEENHSIQQAADFILESPIINKKAFDNMLNFPRYERVDYMNNLISAVGYLAGELNKRVEPEEVGQA